MPEERTVAQAMEFDYLEETPEFRFGLKQRIYNWQMRSARESLGWTQAGLGAVVGMGSQTICYIETLRKFPNSKQAEKIAQALRVPVETLFPEWLTEFKLTQVSPSIEDESISLEQAMATGLLRPATPALLVEGWEEEIEDAVDRERLKPVIDEALDILNPRERKVLTLRFGLDGGESRDMESIGRELGVTRERIRQIEAKALRKLRHPKYTKKLIELI